jgi:glycolate oxidase
VLRQIETWSREFSLPCANVFHAGDGNLHPLILFDANKPGDKERTVAFGDRILQLCIDVGGTITGEHGVGVEKIGLMSYQFDRATMEQFARVKIAFDPGDRINAGKRIPSSSGKVNVELMKPIGRKVPQ